MLSICLFSVTSFAREAEFSFTKDEQIKDIPMDQLYGKSNKIDNNDFLKKPITKLDYVLMSLKELAVINANNLQSKNITKIYFDYQDGITGGKRKPEYLGFARYIDDNGKILVQLNISKLGSPKVAASEACADILIKGYPHFVNYPFPIGKSQGYLYQNQLLGEIHRSKESEVYKDVMKDIADNLIYAVRLDFEDKGNSFFMLCLVDSVDAETAYQTNRIKYKKWSLKLR